MTHPGWGDKWATAPMPTGPVVTERDSGRRRGPRQSRPHRRSRSSRRRLRIVLGVALAFVLLLAFLLVWVAVDALRAREALASGASRIATIAPDAVAGRTDQVEASLDALQQDAAEAVDATNGPQWTIASRLPVLGSTVGAVATLSQVSSTLANGPLANLASVAEVVNPVTVAPDDGRVDLGPLVEVAPTVVEADEQIESAQQVVDGIGGVLVPQVADAVGRVKAELAEVRATTATAARAAQLLPPMLGADGVRRYLVLVQSNAETRALGGIPGSMVLLRAEDGEVVIEDQRPAAALGVFDAPVLPLDESESALFSEKLARFGQNVTMTPDFPRAAQLAAEMWRRRTDVVVDGVLSVDPVAMARVLAVDGPIDVDGQELEGADFVRYLLHGVYLRHEDPQEQDAVFEEVTASAVTRLMSGTSDAAGLVDALAESAREGRVLVWSANTEEQALLDGTVLDGALRGISGGDDPVVGVYTQLTRAAKMGWYLDTTIDVEVVQERPDGSRELAVTVSFTHRGQAQYMEKLPVYVSGTGDDKGMLHFNVLVYAPAGGRLIAAHESDANVGLFPQIHHNLVVGARSMNLSPGETNSVTYVMISGEHQSGNIVIRSTPGPRATAVMINGPGNG